MTIVNAEKSSTDKEFRFGKQHHQILKIKHFIPWLKDTVATDWIHRCSLVFCITLFFSPSASLWFITWMEGSDWPLCLSIRLAMLAAEMFLLNRLWSFSSLGWLVKQTHLELFYSFFLDGRTIEWATGGGEDLCLSSRARRTLARSSALIWSEITICSTTCWAIPARVFCFKSSSTAPTDTRLSHHITGNILKWPLFLLCIWRPDFLQFHGISLFL